MASPNSVLTRGIGSWGNVNLLPTLGYGIESVAADSVAGFIACERPTAFTARVRSPLFEAVSRPTVWIAEAPR